MVECVVVVVLLVVVVFVVVVLVVVFMFLMSAICISGFRCVAADFRYTLPMALMRNPHECTTEVYVVFTPQVFLINCQFPRGSPAQIFKWNHMSTFFWRDDSGFQIQKMLHHRAVVEVNFGQPPKTFPVV
jgi:phosphatidylglycerophosphate synthase